MNINFISASMTFLPLHMLLLSTSFLQIRKQMFAQTLRNTPVCILYTVRAIKKLRKSQFQNVSFVKQISSVSCQYWKTVSSTVKEDYKSIARPRVCDVQVIGEQCCLEHLEESLIATCVCIRVFIQGVPKKVDNNQ